MKIAFFLPNATFDLPGSPEVGGIETFAFTVGEAFQQLGHHVVLFGGQPKPGRAHQPTPLRLELFPYWETQSIPNLGTRFQRLIQRLHFGYQTRHTWLSENIDLALVFKPFDWPVAAYWKKKQPNLQIIMNFQGTDWFWGDRFFFSSIDQSFATSKEVAELAFNRVGLTPSVIPNPVDTTFFSPGEEPTPSPSFHLIASGRLVGWKGFHLLPPAVALARQKGLDITCQLAGEGPERELLEQLIHQHHLEKHFQLLGKQTRPQLRDALRRADAYVAPSIGMEAFSIAALEAASCGLPLILSSNIGFASHLQTCHTPSSSPIDFSQDYLTWSSQQKDELADLLIQMAQQCHQTSWQARQARHERIASSFSAQIVARQILQLAGRD